MAMVLCCAAGNTRPRVILDTDIDSDVDDVGALAMLLNLHNSNKIDLIGIIVTSDDNYAPMCVEAITAFYNAPGIPVAFLHGQPELRNHSRYTRQIANEFSARSISHNDFPDVADLYRKLLSQSGDSSVVLITIGHLSGLQKLLQSPGNDNYSGLSGRELTALKVKSWLCMGGMFPEGKEANFYRPDPESTYYCLSNWTGKVVFCGWEVGKEIVTGGEYLKEHVAKDSPLYRGYELYNNFQGRASWDQVAVLLLDRRSEEYFSFRSDGRCVVDKTGYNWWKEGMEENHSYLIFKKDADLKEIAAYTDKLMIGDPETLKSVSIIY